MAKSGPGPRMGAMADNTLWVGVLTAGTVVVASWLGHALRVSAGPGCHAGFRWAGAFTWGGVPDRRGVVAGPVIGKAALGVDTRPGVEGSGVRVTTNAPRRSGLRGVRWAVASGPTGDGLLCQCLGNEGFRGPVTGVVLVGGARGVLRRSVCRPGRLPRGGAVALAGETGVVPVP